MNKQKAQLLLSIRKIATWCFDGLPISKLGYERI